MIGRGPLPTSLILIQFTKTASVCCNAFNFWSAVRCRTMQCVAVCGRSEDSCSVLQCVAVCCGVLQCVAVRCCACSVWMMNTFQIQIIKNDYNKTDL